MMTKNKNKNKNKNKIESAKSDRNNCGSRNSICGFVHACQFQKALMCAGINQRLVSRNTFFVAHGRISERERRTLGRRSSVNNRSPYAKSFQEKKKHPT